MTEDIRAKTAKFLFDQPEEIKQEVQARIKRTVEIWNIDTEDPFFLVLLQGQIIQVFYESTPNRINEAFDRSSKLYQKQLLELQQQSLKQISDKALKSSTAKLQEAISFVLENNNIPPNRKTRFSPRVVGSMVTAGAMIFSLILGGAVGYSFNNSSIVRDWRENQVSEDLKTLKWAKSEEGKFAKNLLEWNQDLADKSCQKKVRNLGISFKLGSLEIIDGFCITFVVPPK